MSVSKRGDIYLLKAKKVLVEELMSALSSGEWRGMCYLDKIDRCKCCNQPSQRKARRTSGGTWNGFEGEKQEENDPGYYGK